MATLEEEYKQYSGANGVNQMYDAQKQATLAGLESAYNQNLSNAQAQRDALPAQYQARANDLAVQYERNRRNLNQQAAANGLNTGAGSQMQLALGSNYQRDYGGIRTAQQQAIDQADRNINDLKAAYQSSVQQAVANNDYQRLQALMAEYKNQYQQQLNQAQTLASYGNFSGYAGIPGYNQEQIDSMRSAWAAANPQLAYNTGAITAEDYYRMTGKWPAGYAPAGNTGYVPPSNTEAQGKVKGALDALKTSLTQGEGSKYGDYGDDTVAAKIKAFTDYTNDQARSRNAATGKVGNTPAAGNNMAVAQQAANTMNRDDYYAWLVKQGFATQAEVDRAKNGG